MSAILQRRTSALLLLLIFMLPLGLAAETLRLRMIHASSETAKGSDQRLRDVLPVLRNTLAFKSYKLEHNQQIPLPAENTKTRLGAYQIVCSGSANRLNVQIYHGNKRILQTVATIYPKRPVILGGFPVHPHGKRMFVLTVEP